MESSEEMKDNAHNDIVTEDYFFSKPSQNSDAVDLGLLERYKHQQYLGQRLRNIIRLWKKTHQQEKMQTKGSYYDGNIKICETK